MPEMQRHVNISDKAGASKSNLLGLTLSIRIVT